MLYGGGSLIKVYFAIIILIVLCVLITKFVTQPIDWSCKRIRTGTFRGEINILGATDHDTRDILHSENHQEKFSFLNVD